jgi:hypothetical protein
LLHLSGEAYSDRCGQRDRHNQINPFFAHQPSNSPSFSALFLPAPPLFSNQLIFVTFIGAKELSTLQNLFCTSARWREWHELAGSEFHFSKAFFGEAILLKSSGFLAVL